MSQKLEYVFRNKDLGLSHEGIHLMRNGFNHKTVSYKDISSVEVTRGNTLKNKPILLISGIVMVGFSIYLVLSIFEIFQPGSVVERISIEGLLVPVFPLLIGCYSIYAVSKKEAILIIWSEKHIKCSLGGFEKNGQIGEIKDFLQTRTKLKA